MELQVFDALKLSYLRTPYSFTKAFLENHTHPVASLIREARVRVYRFSTNTMAEYMQRLDN